MSGPGHPGDASGEAALLATRNTARFFTEARHISWVLLLFTLIWGAYAYFAMPQRKDPDIPVRVALVFCPWPGASAEQVEQLLTRRLEEKIAENIRVEKIESTSRSNLAQVYVHLEQGALNTGKEFDDIELKLASLANLPDGAGPIHMVKDFGDTAALMLTVASPRIDDIEIDLRAASIRRAIEKARLGTPAPVGGAQRVALVFGYPRSLSPDLARGPIELFSQSSCATGLWREPRRIEGPGFIGLDGETTASDADILAATADFIAERLRAADFHPDLWRGILIRDPARARDALAATAGDKYSYAELEAITDLIARTLKTSPLVSKVSRSGLLEERIFLEYSQERLAAYGIRPSQLPDILEARNTSAPGGTLELGGKTLTIEPGGALQNENDLGEVMVPTAGGKPIYLRDLVGIGRGYETPDFLNFYSRFDQEGRWQRTRAVTLAVQMRSGGQIAEFGQDIDQRLHDLEARLPEDLVLARTSDQPLQVEESVDLFMRSLYEAILLVVLVSLIGFWEWRSALLMALSIPITLAMTFGLVHLLGIDLQQVSIASLIIALGLLVDDPVVAGDAIKRELAVGRPPGIAAWLGPTRLATAILFATITNIVAYLPFLTLSGDTGLFLVSLPVVIACSLIASRVVSMTFIPLLGYYLLRAPRVPRASAEAAAKASASPFSFRRFYERTCRRAIENRWKVLAASLLLVLAGGFFAANLRPQFFPKDLSYLSYVDIRLPEDANLTATRKVAEEVEREIYAALTGPESAGAAGAHPSPMRSLTTFVGGGGPRFWFSVTPEVQQPNYAQVLIETWDKRQTAAILPLLQARLSASIAGAEVDVRELESGEPVGVPVSVRFSGEDAKTLRQVADRAKTILRQTPGAVRVRDDWGAESFAVRLAIDADRANLAGLTHLDIAAASAVGMNGFELTRLRQGNLQIPVVARLRMEERASLGDLKNLYVYAGQGLQKVPLGAVSHLEYGLRTEKIHRRNQFRTITVSAFPQDGFLPSEVLAAALPALRQLERELPPGFHFEVGGEQEKQDEGFLELAFVMLVSVVAIFLALVVQFRNAVKPLLVFAAIPYGMVGAFFVLWLMDMPFGFMAFLGIASLIGVIVSHVIVLFDFIEEAHEKGEPLVEALIEAGIVRLRPVLITVGATVTALFPLAKNGGPLWEPMCYAQIGGLVAATVVTLLLVPVLYAIFVLDLKWVKWDLRRPVVVDHRVTAGEETEG